MAVMMVVLKVYLKAENLVVMMASMMVVLLVVM